MHLAEVRSTIKRKQLVATPNPEPIIRPPGHCSLPNSATIRGKLLILNQTDHMLAWLHQFHNFSQFQCITCECCQASPVDDDDDDADFDDELFHDVSIFCLSSCTGRM